MSTKWGLDHQRKGPFLMIGQSGSSGFGHFFLSKIFMHVFRLRHAGKRNIIETREQESMMIKANKRMAL
ncbi:hypothetical protein D5F53_27250 [Paenibacillus lautus]|uniref:Uncharacterized protein n=1 Tax=Paenibacillus lautus TaxID=1401 RepID=A0A385TWB3_PAELA|nr:hypothetical protein D5F53_27250 [Paenibacillus lautus]